MQLLNSQLCLWIWRLRQKSLSAVQSVWLVPRDAFYSLETDDPLDRRVRCNRLTPCLFYLRLSFALFHCLLIEATINDSKLVIKRFAALSGKVLSVVNNLVFNLGDFPFRWQVWLLFCLWAFGFLAYIHETHVFWRQLHWNWLAFDNDIVLDINLNASVFDYHSLIPTYVDDSESELFKRLLGFIPRWLFVLVGFACNYEGLAGAASSLI